MPGIAVKFWQIGIHGVPGLGIAHPYIFLWLKNTGVVKGCGSDRPYVSKGAVSAKQRGSAFRAETAINGVAACRDSCIFLIVAGDGQG